MQLSHRVLCHPPLWHPAPPTVEPSNQRSALHTRCQPLRMAQQGCRDASSSPGHDAPLCLADAVTTNPTTLPVHTSVQVPGHQPDYQAPALAPSGGAAQSELDGCRMLRLCYLSWLLQQYLGAHMAASLAASTLLWRMFRLAALLCCPSTSRGAAQPTVLTTRSCGPAHRGQLFR